MEEEDNWVPFDALDLIKPSQRPRVVARRFFEINPLGEVRYLEARFERPRYVTVKSVIMNDKEYFMATVGWTRGCQVVIRKLKKELVARFFPT